LKIIKKWRFVKSGNSNIDFDCEMGTVAGWTPREEVKKAARELYEQRKAEIEAPLTPAY
jgi:hypothetical protein